MGVTTRGREWLYAAMVLPATSAAALPFLTLMGLAIHRRAEPLPATAAAVALVLVPGIAVGFAAPPSRRTALFALFTMGWSLLLFALLPVYFPGERREAFTAALALVGLGRDLGDLPDRVAAQLPDDPDLSQPQLTVATPYVEAELPPPRTPDDALALPYEGDGRRMSVPVVFVHEGRELELVMMFDTGATYTTLSLEGLARLGVQPSSDDPVIRLHTANGEREAQLVLLDEVWLGNLRVENVAIATCDACANDDSAGLLGLNVSGAFNLQIDADRREVVFQPRARFDRRLDIKPFSDLSGSFRRYPGGRVEMDVRLDNMSDQRIEEASATITCAADVWTVPMGPLPAGESRTVSQRLPRHTPCETYEIALGESRW